MDDPDGLSLHSTVTDSVIEDGHYAALLEDLERDAQDFEPPTWSLAVEQQYLKPMHKDAIKRQDVIHELVQTEINHVRTLKLMLGVYMQEVRAAQLLEEARLERLFPCLEPLLHLHQQFLLRLKQRRLEAMEPGSEINYCIHRVADILIAQFSEELGEGMRDSYGFFCSQHNNAVALFKELSQSNKKFQNLIRRLGQLSIVRRLGVPEGILLITQRITKYPVLVERILRNTEEDTEEHAQLQRALGVIKDTISQVNEQVAEYERAARLRDLTGRMEPKSQGKVANGRVFRREDMVREGRTLRHDGTLRIRTTAGRVKDIIVVVLSDVLLFLQEKDQRVTFASLEGKPVVMSLQKLIVREVAMDEKAMYLISVSSDTPEMYELLISSREERNSWRELIWQAMESCPEEEEDSDWQVMDAEETLSERLRDFQERLYYKDALIVKHLTEKLQLFAELAEQVAGAGEETPTLCTRLLLRGTTAELQQGEQLLKEAISDVDALQNLLLAGSRAPVSPGDESLPVKPPPFATFRRISNRNGGAQLDGRSRERSQRPNSDPQLRELGLRHATELSADEEQQSPGWSANEEFFSRVLRLSQRLYSLQAVISQQDSHMELQRASAAERERPSRSRGNALLEQEKQRNLEKQREELAQFQRLRGQHQQEQARWERERERHRLQAEEAQRELQRREEACRGLEERLEREREELAHGRREYQEDLERLRDSTRAVERERERLEQQKMLKRNQSLAIPALGGPDNEVLPQLLAPPPPPPPLMLGVMGGDLLLSPKLHPRPGQPQGPPGHPETPPEVPPRRESIHASAAKSDVPIHLISTTNQALKASGVQQKIPTKLAGLGKTKEKGSKAKGSHQRTNSAASIEVSQVLPIKMSGTEGGSLRANRSSSPNLLQPDLFLLPERVPNSKPLPPESSVRKSSRGSAHTLPARPDHRTGAGRKIPSSSPKEDIFFF